VKPVSGKGAMQVKYAIAVNGNQVAEHFGRCEGYEVVELGENGESGERSRLANPGHEPGLLPRMLHEAGVKCIIAGGMGPRAVALLDEYNIKAVTGVAGDVEDVIVQITSGELEAGEDLCEHT